SLHYDFASLLLRVHIYLTLQQLRRATIYEIDLDAIDESLYQTHYDNENLIFQRDSLNAAVAYVRDNLVDVHPTFYPTQIAVQLEPHCHASWYDAWTAEKNKQAVLEDSAQANGGGDVRSTRTRVNAKDGEFS